MNSLHITENRGLANSLQPGKLSIPFLSYSPLPISGTDRHFCPIPQAGGPFLAQIGTFVRFRKRDKTGLFQLQAIYQQKR